MARPTRLKDKVAEDKSVMTEEERREEEKHLRKLGRVQFYLVIGLFIVVIVIMELISRAFGKTYGTIALCVMAAIIAAWLYQEEIRNFFKRK